MRGVTLRGEPFGRYGSLIRIDADFEEPNLPDRYITGPWFDHSPRQLEALLKNIGAKT